MERTAFIKRLRILLICGILGCVLLGCSDFLMIYGNTAYEGKLAWLTLGAAEIPEGRNAMSLGFAFPAVILYALGLTSLRYFIKGDREKRDYGFLTTVGMTPWLCLHLFYIMILFAFAKLISMGESGTAYIISEAVFSQFSWVIILSEVIMLLPFLYYFILILRRKTVFNKLMALNNPLLIYIVLKLITLMMPDVPFRLGFTNALMSESMLIYFLVFILSVPKLNWEKED